MYTDKRALYSITSGLTPAGHTKKDNVSQRKNYIHVNCGYTCKQFLLEPTTHGFENVLSQACKENQATLTVYTGQKKFTCNKMYFVAKISQQLFMQFFSTSSIVSTFVRPGINLIKLLHL